MSDRTVARVAWLVTGLSVVAASPLTAHGQATSNDKAAAQRLYEHGYALIEEGKVAEGCSELEKSQSIEHSIGTMMYLAFCYEQLGRTASAWAMYREAASVAREEGQLDRAKKGNERAAALAPKLSMLTVQVAPENDIAGFVLLRDGGAVAQGLWNVPLPVDPGVHRVLAQAPGRLEWTSDVSVGPDADSATIQVPPLARDPQAAAAPAPRGEPGEAPANAATVANVEPLAAPTRTAGWPAQRTAGVVVGGVGVVALGVGGFFGLRAMSKNNDAKKTCKGTACDDPGLRLTKDAQKAATLANVFVIGGAVLAATGVVLLVVSGRGESERTLGLGIDPTSARVTLGGAF